MRTRTMGNRGPQVPVVGLGTWKMEQDDRESAIAALRAGLDAGATHIDTAELYGHGEVERLVADAIANRRDELYLVSKVLPHNASRTGTSEACDASLKRLRADRLDLYLLHWTGEFPLEETFEAFERLLDAGKIGAYGVSNFDVPDLEAAHAIVGPGKIACNQVLYHLQERAIEHGVVPWCRKHDVAIVAYSPFGDGRFPEPGTSGRKALDRVANELGATAHQVALAFLLREEGSFVIPKTATPERAKENAAAADVVLAPEHVEALDAAFPRGRRKPLPTA